MYGEDRFICPICGTGTSHHWYMIYVDTNDIEITSIFHRELITKFEDGDDAISVCGYCRNYCLWKDGQMVYPASNLLIQDPNEDLPENIRTIYDEARNIFQYSSRSSAALLRMALESILTEMGYETGRLVDKIDALIKSEGASQELVMAAEIIRHYGNSSAHIGFIDLNEDKEAAEELFMVLNLIAEHQYTRPKRLKALMDKLPDAKRAQVEKKLEQLQE